MKEKRIKEIFSRLKDHREKAPEGLLEDVRQEMARRGMTLPSARKKTARIVQLRVLRALTATAAILVFGLFLWTLFQRSDPSSRQMALEKNDFQQGVASRHDTVQGRKRNESLAGVGQEPVAGVSSPQHVASPPVNRCVAVNVDVRDQQQPQTVAEDNHFTASAKETDQMMERSKGDTLSPIQNLQIAQNTQTTKSPSRPKYQYADVLNQYHHQAQAVSPLYVGIYYGGMGTASSSSSGVLLASADPIGDYRDEMSGDKVVGDMLGSGDVRIRTKHHQPIKSGISVRYNFNDRWGIQTGITYSLLSSDFTYENHDRYYVKNQKLHYLGIPVSASYSVMRGRHYNVYTIAGVELEKLVHHEASPVDIPVKESCPQYSANASFGAELKFTAVVSVYVEPGFIYSFNNGSDVENIYKEKPFNFNLNVGLRVNINK